MDRIKIALDTHRAGLNCCASVLMAFRDKIGLTEQQCYGISSGMGGGLRTGNVCGALIGGVMVLGMLFPHDPTTGAEGKAYNAELTKRLQSRFAEKQGDTLCRVIKPREAQYQSEAYAQKGAKSNCDHYIALSVELVEEIIREEEK